MRGPAFPIKRGTEAEALIRVVPHESAARKDGAGSDGSLAGRRMQENSMMGDDHHGLDDTEVRGSLLRHGNQHVLRRDLLISL
jgi:hypothetical protein